MKKILALLLVLALSLTLVACGSGNTTETKAPEVKPAETKADAAQATEAQAAAPEYKVAMVTDYGDITDQSFNQTTWEAVVAVGKDNNLLNQYKKTTPKDTPGPVGSG